ncbi:MAG: hypothetical protein AAGE01_01065 [Pseudomonadota bacterium]
MHFLKTFWPAMLVTLGAAVAAYAFASGVIDLLLLLASAASWAMAAMLLEPRPAAASAPARAPAEEPAPEPEKEAAEQLDEAIQDSVCMIVDRVNIFIDEEVEILNDSLQQIQQLAKDAVETLSGSMRSLSHQVRTQSKLLNQLAGVASEPVAIDDGEEGDEGVSWTRYIEDSQSVITYFIRLLDDVEKQRSVVEGGLKELLSHANSARDHVDNLPPGTSKDLRLSVTRVRTSAQRQLQALSESPRMSRERTDATEAMDRISVAREELQEMRDIVMMNVEAFARQSHADVGRAIQSLQFEDIVTQLVTGAQGRLDEMNRLVNSLTERVERLKLVDAANEPIGVLRVVAEIESDVLSYTDRLRASRHKPVGQQNLDEGSIELF